jgi:dimethylamine/trimethylamine dehydrogenase
MRRVHLVDAAPEIGGVLRWIPRLPRLGEWGRLLNYRQIQLGKLRNVEVITRAELDVGEALDYGAEIIVVATGASFATDGSNYVDHAPIPGADASQPHCLTPEQIMLEGKEVPGKTVAILDYDGYVTGLGLAESLRTRGHEVVYVTPFPHAASYTRYTGELPNVHRLMAELEVRVLSEKVVSEIKPGEIAVHGLYDTGFRRFPDESGSIRVQTKAAEVVEADAVVLVGDRQSRTALYRGLLEQRDRWDEAGVKGVYRVGDCVAPRQLSEAIFDGHRLAREIDSPNPAVPLPVRREIYHWGATRDSEIDARAYLAGTVEQVIPTA